MYEMSSSWEYSVAGLRESEKNKESNHFCFMKILFNSVFSS